MHSEFIKEVQSSRTAILFIHGIIGTPRHFDSFMPHVPDNWSIYNILLDGHGGDVSDMSRTSMEKWRSQVSHVTERLAQRYDNIVIAAHSMGALFAVDEALKRPHRIKAMLLLAVPLVISLKSSAVVNSFKVLFDRVDENDLRAYAAKCTYGIRSDPRLWRYIGWLPRYVELFTLAAETRSKFPRLKTPFVAFYSADDELVSLRSLKYISKARNARIRILPRSGHFYYESKDHALLLKSFSNMTAALENKFKRS